MRDAYCVNFTWGWLTDCALRITQWPTTENPNEPFNNESSTDRSSQAYGSATLAFLKNVPTPLIFGPVVAVNADKAQSDLRLKWARSRR